MAVNHEALPVELWLEIFRRLEERSDAFLHAPFERHPQGVKWDVKSAYTNIVLVCQNWHTWAIGLLYHNIQLPDPSTDDTRLEVHQRYGHWVRRAIVPYSSTVTESYKPMLSTKMLALYPSLQTLVRPPHRQSPMQTLKYEFDATCPPLPSLKRLEWWNYPDAAQTGGINSLTAVLSAAPNLEYLFVGIEVSHGVRSLRPTGRMDLQSLHTLRLCDNPWSNNYSYFTHLSLPALRHLIIEMGMVDVGIEGLLQPQLVTLEFGPRALFKKRYDLGVCLQSCPVLREINYSLYAIPPLTGTTYPSITSIGFHFVPFQMDHMDDPRWALLGRHLQVFAGEMFPNLQRLRLFGELEQLLTDARFLALQEQLTSRGCIVEIADAGGHLSVYTP
ncbi:hypothetical protein C8R46DRAFT_420960 [Mycena filopes]|nr:hypothetical protein C8R46DRAFT_420960 [Mycena filopes]